MKHAARRNRTRPFSTRRPGAWLQLQELEDRSTPVILSGSRPVGMVPGDGNFEAYTGVVQIRAGDGGSGSGSLIQSTDLQGFGSYVLTAAHVPTGGDATVRFDLPPRIPGGLVPVRIELAVPAGAGYAHNRSGIRR